MNTPRKLKHDCILEALVEFRFDVDEPTEIVIGRLLDCPLWESFAKRRTPISDIPIQVRLSDANLRYQPLYELTSPDKALVAKIGSHVLSVHVLKPYQGWDVFFPQLTETIKYTLERLPKINIQRVGLRYVNATVPGVHGIKTLSDLNINISMGKDVIEDEYNVNYIKALSENSELVARIASPSFIEGPLPDDASSFVDIDVHTLHGLKGCDVETLCEWVDFAHDEEKKEFFRILPEEVVEGLKEE